MSKLVEGLVERAFFSGPARHANQLIEEARQRVGDRAGRALNYEVALDGRGWCYLEKTVAPRLALYLQSKCLTAATSSALFVSLFHGDTLYFISGPDFMDYVQLVMEVDDRTFEQMFEVWGRTGCPIGASSEPSSGGLVA